MNSEELKKHFARIGVRAFIDRDAGNRNNTRRSRISNDLFQIDIQSDSAGEFVKLDVGRQVNVTVSDIRPDIRHLLLMARFGDTAIRKEKFVCGFDERHWFVSPIPQSGGVASVQSALEALKPTIVKREQERRKVRKKDSLKRRTAAWIRQGEWFFIPEPNLNPPDWMLMHREPLQRGLGKPHLCEFIFRQGGQRVYVSKHHRWPLNRGEYRAFLSRNPNARNWKWDVRVRDPIVFAKGWVRHPDHKTIALSIWHRVVMNTETDAPSMRHVAFLD